MTPTIGEWLLWALMCAIIATAFGYIAWDSLRRVDWTPSELAAQRARDLRVQQILSESRDRRAGTDRRVAR